MTNEFFLVYFDMRKKMRETEYRASRVCRILGNPTAYQIIKLLMHSRDTPSGLAKKIGLSLPVISLTLKTLRNIDLVRYDTKGNEKMYSIKDETISHMCQVIERFVTRMRHKMW